MFIKYLLDWEKLATFELDEIAIKESFEDWVLPDWKWFENFFKKYLVSSIYHWIKVENPIIFAIKQVINNHGISEQKFKKWLDIKIFF